MFLSHTSFRDRLCTNKTDVNIFNIVRGEALGRWLHRVTVPTQIIWGANDKLFPSVYSEPWKQGIPDARVEIIPECGHAVTADKGDACAATILSFLAGR